MKIVGKRKWSKSFTCWLCKKEVEIGNPDLHVANADTEPELQFDCPFCQTVNCVTHSIPSRIRNLMFERAREAS